MHWYYEERGAQIGPLSEERFAEAVASGKVLANTLVWNETLTGWTRYGALIAKPPAIPQPAPAGSLQTCSQCSRNFPEQDLIQYGGLRVCAGCKPAFFQRLKEEGRVTAIWRDGSLLVAASETVLPDRCVKCNAPAHGLKMKKKFYWHHPAFYLLICAGILIYAIVALVVRKTSTVHLGVCAEHKSRRSRSVAITWITVGLAVALMIFAAGADLGWLALLGALLLLGGIIFGVIATQLVVPTKIDHQSVVWLKGVSPSYLESLPSYQRY